MTDNHSSLISLLKQVGLPVHYEMTLTKDTKTPCISYMEISNNNYLVGDTVGYSFIDYQIKVWGNKIADIQKYSLMIDDILRPIGYKRIASIELYDNNSTMIQKVMTYEINICENYN